MIWVIFISDIFAVNEYYYRKLLNVQEHKTIKIVVWEMGLRFQGWYKFLDGDVENYLKCILENALSPVFQ